jgi:hypothetical protein
VVLAAASAASAVEQVRGFNSWNSFTQWATAADLIAQADFMKASGMQALNWTYVVADGGWYYDPLQLSSQDKVMHEYMDAHGRLVPDPGRYPKGWKGVCDELHAKGFKCGFHLFRGVPGRAWEEASPILGSGENYTVRDAGFNVSEVQGHGAFYEINVAHPAAQQYLDSMFALYCSWGMDFLKLDGMGSSGARSPDDHAIVDGGRMNPINGGVPVAKAYRAAIAKGCGGRKVVLSLSAGGTGIPGWVNETKSDFITDEFVEAVQDTIEMTRVTPDTWDIWDDEPGETSCPLARYWANMGRNRDAADPKYANVTGHSGCCWGGRIAQHFVEFAHFAHIADAYGVLPDGDMLQIGRVGAYENLRPETLANYSSPKFAVNANCSVAQLQGSGPMPAPGQAGAIYDTSLCPRQSYLTYEEQKTLVSLWSIARSPLIMGGELTQSPQEIVALLTNEAVMEMNWHSEQAREVYRNESDGRCAWVSLPTPAGANAGGEARYVGLFNTAAAAQPVGVSFAALGFGGSTSKCKVTDMWEGKELGLQGAPLDELSGGSGGGESGVSATVPKHGAVLLHLTGCR